MPAVFNVLHWLSGIVLIYMGFLCYRKSMNKTTLYACTFIALLAGWCFFAALVFNHPDLEVKIQLNRIKLIFCILVPTGLFLFVRSFKSESISRITLAIILIIPVAAIFLVISPYHEFFIGHYKLENFSNYEVLTFKDGPGFIVHALQTRGLFLWALFLLGSSLFSNQYRQRKQEWIVLVCFFLPFAIDVLAVSFIPYLRFMQFVPIAMTMSLVVLYFVVYKGDALEIVPVARNLIFDSIDEIYLVLDKNKRLVDFNVYSRKALGLSNVSYGKTLDKVDFQHNKIGINLARALKEDNNAKEFLIVQENSIEYFSINFEGINNTIGEKIGSIVIVKNMTDQKKFEKQLTQIVEIRTKFIGIIAHDLIGNISSHSLLLETVNEHPQILGDADLKGSINLLLQSSQNISKFITGLSAWSKDNLENFHLKRKLNDLRLLINESLQYLSPIAIQKNITCIVNIPEGVFANIDFDMLHTAVRNIIANAIKLSPDNSTLRIETRMSSDSVELLIIDEGPGINEVEMNQFLTRLDLSSYKGGLGLTLARDFIHLNNGVITARNNTPKGSEFSIKLPLLS